MRFAVVDDEPGILKQIPVLIRQFSPDIKIETDTFSSSSEFLSAYTSQKYDALFLDIDMPDMNGFALAEHLRHQNDLVPIVYITARDDLMIQAFRYKALGFVRKQFIENELPYAISTIMNELCKHQLSKISMQSFPIKLYLKGNSTMIDALYNYRQGDIHSAEFSDEFNALCIPFEESLTEAQLTTFHKLLDCVSETAAHEMRAAYKVGFKDGAALMKEIQG